MNRREKEECRAEQWEARRRWELSNETEEMAEEVMMADWRRTTKVGSSGTLRVVTTLLYNDSELLGRLLERFHNQTEMSEVRIHHERDCMLQDMVTSGAEDKRRRNHTDVGFTSTRSTIVRARMMTRRLQQTRLSLLGKSTAKFMCEVLRRTSLSIPSKNKYH